MNAFKINGYQRHQLVSTDLPADVAFGETEAVARKRWLSHHGADCRITACRQLSEDEALQYLVKALANTASPAVLRAMLAAGQAGGAQ